MDQRLKEVCQRGDIDAFYASIREDPYLLENIDKIPFVDTPLHIAIEAEQSEFALEIMRLKPSFAWKPNQDGFSPMHLALQKEQTQMVLWLVEDDPELVRVKGREGVTPLHYVSGTGDLDLLARFLSVCPQSVKDLTIQRETALHIALKNNMLKAFEFLVVWLQPFRYDSDLDLKRAVLNSRDVKGNTVLHVAVAINKPEVVRLLVKNQSLDVNVKNREGLTALDIFHQTQFNSGEVKDILCQAGALRASSLPFVTSIADYLLPSMSIFERWIISFYRARWYMSSENRNAVLVVAVLIATATFQAGVSPPDGSVCQDYHKPPNLNTTAATNDTALSASSPPPHHAGWLGKFHITYVLSSFTLYNSLAFCMSSIIILFLVPTDDHFGGILIPPLYMLLLCHIISVVMATSIEPLRLLVSYSTFSIFILVAFVLVGRTLRKYKFLLQHQIPTLKSYI